MLKPSFVVGLAKTTQYGAVFSVMNATAGANGEDLPNPCFRGVKVVVDITSLTGTAPTLTVTIQGKDEVSGKYYTLLASAALSAAGTTVLTVFPGLTAVANSKADDVLPSTWRIITTSGGTVTDADYTISAVGLP